MKRIISLVLCIIMVFTLVIPAFAADSGKLELKFQVGSSKMSVNGKTWTIDKPYSEKGIVMIPLTAIVNTFGTELNLPGNGKVNVVYRDITIDLTLGEKKCYVNQEEKTLPSAPKKVNNKIMVPARFIAENLGANVSYDSKTNSVVVILEDDGAISDFSSLIGSINKQKIGNSYFGWNIGIPKGSQLVDNSFNSKSVSIENRQRGLTMSVSVEKDTGKTLDELADGYKKADENSLSSEYLSDDYIGDVKESSVNKSANPSYVEILADDFEYGVTIMRIYKGPKYIYKVMISYINGITVEKLKKDTNTIKILNSFGLGYKGNLSDVQDFSKVKDGFVEYREASIGLNFKIQPEWDNLNSIPDATASIGRYGIKLGINNREYMSITPVYSEKISDPGKYAEFLQKSYTDNYNSKYYTFNSIENSTILEQKSYDLNYSIQLNKQKYIYDESIVGLDGLLYIVKFCSPENNYSQNKALYQDILDSMKYNPDNAEKLKNILQEDGDNVYSYRIGKDDGLVDYENKAKTWKIKIPGYWTALDGFDKQMVYLYNDTSMSFIGIEAVENNADTSQLPDEKKYKFMGSILDDGNIKFTDKETIFDKGTNIKVYNYRYESDQDEDYEDIRFYIFEKDNYSYCFVYGIQDLFASDKNIKEVQDIWTSFIPES